MKVCRLSISNELQSSRAKAAARSPSQDAVNGTRKQNTNLDHSTLVCMIRVVKDRGD